MAKIGTGEIMSTDEYDSSSDNKKENEIICTDYEIKKYTKV